MIFKVLKVPVVITEMQLPEPCIFIIFCVVSLTPLRK